MATLGLSGFCRLALRLAAAAMLILPAQARHHHRHKSHLPPVSRNATPQMPPTAPIPEPRPDAADSTGTGTSEQGAQQQPSTHDDFVPQTPAVVATPPEKPTEPEAEPPNAAPVPAEKPPEIDKGETGKDESGKDETGKGETGEEKIPADPRSAELPADKMPEQEVACRERLKALGVDFEEHQAEHDAEIGCSIPYPIVLKTLGKSIAIGSGTELNCQMAEAAARFAADVIQPAAKAEFGTDLKSIGQASAYVCRPRHNGGRLSEHAFGNALDIASFTLSDGRKIEVGPVPPEQDAKFLNTVRKAACGPFKTVLGPGSDPDHSLHFHLDLEPRRHGGTFCQ
ncbi:extensin family protein [Mesorhizobium sp. M3A.F.Ca.ET.080.04.2.1]|uniref:extensin-like domain-containing protein n=3 Tax=Mesorhizobium TaxID=68287 RepID=UPI000BB07992|nr:extensin family protein [Mesorhizobium sp.]AZO11882.1 extensin family protein [Mesorhizobium sp. M3A.F.Ca.ET.080.04.2.1]PBB86223.1 extensin family protein [Mesorhizobium sp. WSM3876]TGS65079.1 extensin family protein [Mesorhizobium sp. M3A.F.Ca.ET.201.01.1.1]TGT57386.1 extensin family protein [Mesorhizobium sp. M00.F.Ca.ET.170.01.1.1]RWB73163.1 MAG: extensin family protein [Mesorhizobium sp.]